MAGSGKVSEHKLTHPVICSKNGLVVVCIVTVTVICSLGTGCCCTFPAVPRSAQPSTLCGMVWVSAIRLST